MHVAAQNEPIIVGGGRGHGSPDARGRFSSRNITITECAFYNNVVFDLAMANEIYVSGSMMNLASVNSTPTTADLLTSWWRFGDHPNDYTPSDWAAPAKGGVLSGSAPAVYDVKNQNPLAIMKKGSNQAADVLLKLSPGLRIEAAQRQNFVI